MFFMQEWVILPFQMNAVVSEILTLVSDVGNCIDTVTSLSLLACHDPFYQIQQYRQASHIFQLLTKTLSWQLKFGRINNIS